MARQRRHVRRNRHGRVYSAGRRRLAVKKVGRNFLVTKFTPIGAFFRAVSNKELKRMKRLARRVNHA